jgi:hypothetical protein
MVGRHFALLDRFIFSMGTGIGSILAVLSKICLNMDLITLLLFWILIWGRLRRRLKSFNRLHVFLHYEKNLQDRQCFRKAKALKGMQGLRSMPISVKTLVNTWNLTLLWWKMVCKGEKLVEGKFFSRLSYIAGTNQTMGTPPYTY